MKKKLLFIATLFVSSLSILNAQRDSICLVTGNATADGPYITQLQNAGYGVHAVSNNWINLPADSVAKLNGFDLIIFTRQIPASGAYGGTDANVRARWQSVTTPILMMADVVVRSSRLQMLNNDTPNGSVDTIMVAKDPNHVVFTNTVLNSNDSTKTLTTERYQCTSATSAGNGTILASNPKNGWVTMAEWDSNTACYVGAGIQNGKRFWYAASFSYNLTNAGKTLFLDIVEYLLTGTVSNKVEPTDILLSTNEILEGEQSGTAVGILSASDPQGDIASFALVAGTGDTDNASFTIDGDTLRSAAVFDYEVNQSLSVRIQVTDSAANVFEKIFTISVISGTPRDITLSNNTILEGEPVGTTVGELSALDPQGDIASYALVTGEGDTDNASFTIDGETLKTAVVFNYETTQSLSLRIQVTDLVSNTYQKVFTINVQDKPSAVDFQMADKPEIYPTPARNYLMIKNIERFEGSIISITGQTVLTFKQSNASLDISGLEKGMYLITLTAEGERYVYRFIKE